MKKIVEKIKQLFAKKPVVVEVKPEPTIEAPKKKRVTKKDKNNENQ